MAPRGEDELRMLKDALRLLADHVELRLLARGWQVTSLDVTDETPLEWYWPPTAPAEYGGRPQRVVVHSVHNQRLEVAQRSPWRTPTRLIRLGKLWYLRYGSAIALEPDASRVYTDERGLIMDLENIECWPMTREEARQLRNERIIEEVTAAARGHLIREGIITEPYESRLQDIATQLHYEDAEPAGRHDVSRPTTRRRRGDLAAQAMVVRAEAWASHVRSERAGGPDWNPNKPVAGS